MSQPSKFAVPGELTGRYVAAVEQDGLDDDRLTPRPHSAASSDRGVGGTARGERDLPVLTCLRAGARRDAAAARRDIAARLRDRAAVARDRRAAARDRSAARADRERLAQRLRVAEVDALTGARTRAAGLTELGQELDRCRRSTGQLVVAYVDVVGLKHRNDTQGHHASDELLVCVVKLIRTRLRPYDLIVRLGGDEFLCAMSDMTLAEARTRFEALSTALAAQPQAGAISSGFAALAPDETAAELIARADRELHDSRRSTTDSRSTRRSSSEDS